MFTKAAKFTLPSTKMLSKNDLLNFKGGVEAPGGGGGGTPPGDDGGSVTQFEYCAQLFAIISCNANQTTQYFVEHGCVNGRPASHYWNSAVQQGIPMNSPGCDTSWY